MKYVDIILVSVGTVLAGIVASWLQARTQSGSLNRKLEQTDKLLNFLDRWVGMSTRIDSIQQVSKKDNAEQFLDLVLADLFAAYKAEVSIPKLTKDPKIDFAMSSIKRACLIYAPQSVLGWITVFIFYGFSLLLIIHAFGFSRLGWTTSRLGIIALELLIASVAYVFSKRAQLRNFVTAHSRGS